MRVKKVNPIFVNKYDLECKHDWVKFRARCEKHVGLEICDKCQKVRTFVIVDGKKVYEEIDCDTVIW